MTKVKNTKDVLNEISYAVEAYHQGNSSLEEMEDRIKDLVLFERDRAYAGAVEDVKNQGLENIIDEQFMDQYYCHHGRFGESCHECYTESIN